MIVRLHTPIVCLAIAALAFGAVHPAVAAKSQKGYFVPGLSITPNVFEADGQTMRTYRTAAGPSLWSPEFPIKQGDKLSLKVFATTGGSELVKLVIRLDNVKIADLTTAPWTAMIDTATLSPGSHMVEAWAQNSTDPSKSVTKTLSFVVVDKLPQQQTVDAVGSAVIEPDQPSGAEGAGEPKLPTFLNGKTIDADASVEIRANDPDVDRALTTNTDPVQISIPVTLYCERTSGSAAVTYAYAITRGDKVVIESADPGSLQYRKIRLQPLSGGKGLLPGNVSLWVWGIDKLGHPSNPVHRNFTITAPSADLTAGTNVNSASASAGQ